MAESTSNEYRPPSGHDEDFVEAVDEDFQCLICHLPLKEPERDVATDIAKNVLTSILKGLSSCKHR